MKWLQERNSARASRRDDDADLVALVTLADDITRDLGIVIQVAPAQYSIGDVLQRGFYSLRTRCSTSGPFSFGQAWTHLNGFRCGVEAARRR